MYTGRGPVCGIITRRAGADDAAAATGASACAAGAAGGACGSAAAEATGAVGGAALTGAGDDKGAFMGAEAVGGAAGFTTTEATDGADAIAGLASIAGATGGFATIGPAGGLAAIAGACGGGGAMTADAWRGCGTILRGAGRAASTGAVGGAWGRGSLDGTFGATLGATLVATGGATGAAIGFATGGWGAGRLAASASSSLRCWIALSTSPGFETRDQSIFGFASASARPVDAPPALPPRLKCVRTRSASSNSKELECVFFSVTPTSVSTSKIALLFTSSSRARSLIRTLLIRPFCFSRPKRSAVHSNLMPVGIDPVCIIA